MPQRLAQPHPGGHQPPRRAEKISASLTLYQLLGYVLHDHDDAHEITSVALYQARYGHLAAWRLDRLLHDLADQQVDLPALRHRWGLMLETGDVPTSQGQ